MSQQAQLNSSLPSTRTVINQDYVLPDIYVLEDNPYECVDFGHIRMLQYLRTDSISSSQLLNVDSVVCKEAANIYKLCESTVDADAL